MDFEKTLHQLCASETTSDLKALGSELVVWLVIGMALLRDHSISLDRIPMLGQMDGSRFTEPFAWLGDLAGQYGLQTLATILLIIAGWVLARMVRMLVIRGLRIVRLDMVAERAGIDGVLRKGNIQQDSIEILGALVYWLLIILILVMVMKVWNLEIGLSDHLVPFLPKIFVALVVLILGLFLAAFIGDLVRTAAANAEMAYASLLGQLVRWVIVIFIVLTAIRQLGIEAQLISYGFLMIVGGICLGMALAIGLGARPIVEERLRAALEKYEDNAKKDDQA